MKTSIYIIIIIPLATYILFLQSNCNQTETRIHKKYNNESMMKPNSINDYSNAIKNIAEDIEALKNQYPQLINFNSAINVDTVNLSISYEYKTHISNQLAGWLAAVPNPDDNGIWFYIDFHSPDSQAQIHTQPLMPDLCIGDKKVAFLILEGQKTQSIREHLNKILNNCGVGKCIN